MITTGFAPAHAHAIASDIARLVEARLAAAPVRTVHADEDIIHSARQVCAAMDQLDSERFGEGEGAQRRALETAVKQLRTRMRARRLHE